MDLKKQILFWVTVFTLLVGVFTRYYQSFSEAFYFVSMLFPVVVGSCYFFNLYLVNQYLIPGRYALFVLYTIYMVVISLYLEMVVIFLAFIFLAEYTMSNTNPVSTDIYVLAITLYMIVFFYSFIYFVQTSKQKERTIQLLKEEKEKQEVGSFVVRENRVNRQLLYSEVLYIESLADYVKIHLLNGQTVQTKEKISTLAQKLPDPFLRIHRSFIVNRNAISTFSKETVTVNNQELSISRTFKERVLATLVET